MFTGKWELQEHCKMRGRCNLRTKEDGKACEARCGTSFIDEKKKKH